MDRAGLQVHRVEADGMQLTSTVAQPALVDLAHDKLFDMVRQETQ